MDLFRHATPRYGDYAFADALFLRLLFRRFAVAAMMLPPRHAASITLEDAAFSATSVFRLSLDTPLFRCFAMPRLFATPQRLR